MKMLKMKSFLRSRKDRNTAASTLVTLEGLVQVEVVPTGS